MLLLDHNPMDPLQDFECLVSNCLDIYIVPGFEPGLLSQHYSKFLLDHSPMDSLQDFAYLVSNCLDLDLH
jgi:hypothetical protein